jgi:tetrahydromethanopterin S-methyltransferase subunit A
MAYKWVKQKVDLKKKIKATHDSLKEWHPDPKGYFLIRINGKRIEAGYVTNKHVISKMVYGKNAIELYNTIVREKLITRLKHAAYLGKELYKAEICLRYGLKYVQEAPLKIKKTEEVKFKHS